MLYKYNIFGNFIDLILCVCESGICNKYDNKLKCFSQAENKIRGTQPIIQKLTMYRCKIIKLSNHKIQRKTLFNLMRKKIKSHFNSLEKSKKNLKNKMNKMLCII